MAGTSSSVRFGPGSRSCHLLLWELGRPLILSVQIPRLRVTEVIGSDRPAQIGPGKDAGSGTTFPWRQVLTERINHQAY